MRSACPYMYRWVNIFARSVPVYALVDGYVGVCVYVFMRLSMYMLLLLCIYTYIYLFIHPSIHTYMRPSRKLKIETIPKFKIQFPKLEIQNPISDLRLKLKLKFQNYFLKTY